MLWLLIIKRFFCYSEHYLEVLQWSYFWLFIVLVLLLRRLNKYLMQH